MSTPVRPVPVRSVRVPHMFQIFPIFRRCSHALAKVSLVFALTSLPLMAEDTQMRFDIRLGALKVGHLGVAANETDQTYAVRAQFQDTGLVGILVGIRFDAHAQGTRLGTSLIPRKYEENVDTGRRQSLTRLQYDAGLPQVLGDTPTSPLLIALEDQRGTVDPLTALYTVLRSGPAPCDKNIPVFDGRRRSLLSLGPMREGQCSGNYRRIAGYSDAEMRERASFPLTLRFTGAEGRSHLVEAKVDTLWGPATLTRQ